MKITVLWATKTKINGALEWLSHCDSNLLRQQKDERKIIQKQIILELYNTIFIK